MIVIDIGCARYGNDYSIERLVEEFEPRVIYGFDPNVSDDLLGFHTWLIGGQPDRKVEVEVQRSAAWLYDGEIGFVSAGLTSWLTEMPEKPRTPCFDLVRFIRDLPSDEEMVLKMDAEKSEYELLERLIKTRTDELLKLIWVEWHCVSCGRGAGGHRPECLDPVDRHPRRQWIEENISCELAEWCW